MIKGIITDFDGTLVDTFGANYYAYNLAFEQNGRHLSKETYRECFGLRFPEFMYKVGITDEKVCQSIKEIKASIYQNLPADMYKVNKKLVTFLQMCKKNDIQVAIASTAARANLMSALNKLHLTDLFDVIIAGEDVKRGKPYPDVYEVALDKLHIQKDEALVFEDSEVGMTAARAAGINYIQIKNI